MSDPNQPPQAFPPNQPPPTPGYPQQGPPGHVPYATPMSHGYPGPYIGPPPSNDDRTWGMLAHLSALAGFIVPVVGNIVGPLIVWLSKKDQPFVADQGKESLNFQLTMVIIAFVTALTICIGIGIFLLPLVGLVALIFEIVAAVQANQGVAYRYPFNIRFFK